MNLILGMSLLISLRKGDNVSVRTGDNSGAIFGGHYTSLSGCFVILLVVTLFRRRQEEG